MKFNNIFRLCTNSGVIDKENSKQIIFAIVLVRLCVSMSQTFLNVFYVLKFDNIE